jgi:hypothetical protein
MHTLTGEERAGEREGLFVFACLLEWLVELSACICC